MPGLNPPETLEIANMPMIKIQINRVTIFEHVFIPTLLFLTACSAFYWQGYDGLLPVRSQKIALVMTTVAVRSAAESWRKSGMNSVGRVRGVAVVGLATLSRQLGVECVRSLGKEVCGWR